MFWGAWPSETILTNACFHFTFTLRLAAGQVLSSQPNRSRPHKTIRLTAGANPRPPEYGAAALTTTPTRRWEAAGRCRIDARPSAAAGGHCRLESAESRVSRVFHLVTGGFLGTTTYHQMRLDELYTPTLKIQSNFQKKGVFWP